MNEWVLPELLAGDIVFVKNRVTGWRTAPRWIVSWAIRLMSTQSGEGPTFANHVCTVHGPHRVWRQGGFVPADYAVYEALGKEGFVKRWLCEQYRNDYTDVVIYRDTRLTRKDRIRIMAAHQHLAGKRYAKVLVGTHAADYAVTRFWQGMGGTGECRAFRWLYHQFVNRKQDVDYSICSWAVGYVWDVWLERPFKAGYKVATPDDLHDECEESWTRIFVFTNKENSCPVSA